MEVLSSPSPPITLSPRASRSPLLARRSSRQAVPLLDDTPTASSSTSSSPLPAHTLNSIPIHLASHSHLNFVLTPSSSTPVSSSHTTVQASGPSSASTSFTPRTPSSSTTATATSRAPRRVNSSPMQASAGVMGFLPFIPLTPIMASPRLTPDPGAGAGVTDGGGEEVQRRFGLDGGVSGSLSTEGDYLGVHAKTGARPSQTSSMRQTGAVGTSLSTGNVDAKRSCSDANVGLPASSSSSSSIRQRRLVTPSWTSTPPTPPHSKGLRARTLSNPGENVSIADGFQAQRRSRLSQPRPASVAFFPDPTTRGDPSSSTSRQFTISTERYDMGHAAADANARAETLGAHSNAYTQPDYQVKRRQSLPPNFWKPLPPIPLPPRSSPTHSTAALTRPRSRPFLRSKKPLGDIQQHQSTSIPRSPNSSLASAQFLMPGDLVVGANNDGGEENVLSPSLSRVPKALSRRASSPLRMGVIASEADHLGHNSNSNEGLRESTSAGSSYKSALSSPAFPSPDPQSPRSSKDSAGKRIFRLDADDDDADEDEHAKLSRESSLQREHSSEDGQKPAGAGPSASRSKRYHAILELLTTELGYLMDLKALVSVYLSQLDTLSVPIPSPSPSRPSPSSLSISGLTRSFPSRTHLAAHPPSITNSAFGLGPPEVGECGGSRPASPEFGGRGCSKESKIPTRRSLLSESELALVKRNAEELVAFHERFIGVLKSALIPFGFASVLDGRSSLSTDVGNVDEVVKAIAGAFVKEASAFEIYQGFCPGHNEATDLIRSVQDHYPVEWDAFERRCSLLVAHSSEGSPELPTQHSSESLKKKRRHSTPSLSTTPLALTSPSKSDPVHGRPRRPTDGSQSQIGRLKFLDYLIKPVQRICKYPLLLDLLKPKGAVNGIAGSDIVESAGASMRHVCGLVDEASMKQAHSIKSALIVSRIMASRQDEKTPNLPPDFLNSLGVCLLAGALDVVHHTSASRARYLGAFLYVGGYLILVKIPKSGKVYEPKFWLSLIGFEALDIDEDDAAFPFSFHLFGNGHHLQFAAACQHEKEIWLAGIQEATTRSASWKNEPTTNLQMAEKEKSPITAAALVEEPHDLTSPGLPTIQSMGELEDHDDMMQIPRTYSRPFKTMPRLEGSAFRNEQLGSGYTPLSRRSSTASVKAFFALSFETSSRISRPSSQVRQQVDHGLRDVFSDSCIAVRSQAQMRGGELFQVRRKHSAGMSRSNSGLSISTAMNFASKRNSVLVSHKRKNSSENAVLGVTSDPENSTPGVLKISRRTKSFSARRQHKQPVLVLPPPLSTLPVSVETASPEPMSESPTPSPMPFSRTSSLISSNVNSTLPSPHHETLPLPTPSHVNSGRSTEMVYVRKDEYKPKRARSMVDNVRYFFHSRSPLPTPPLSAHSTSPTIIVSPLEEDTPSPLVQWWRRGSLRRRVQSSPDTPIEDSGHVTPAQSSEDSHSTSQSHSPSQGKIDMEQSQSSPAIPSSPTTPRRVAFSETKPIRRRSLFVPSLRHNPTSPSSSEGTLLSPRRSIRNVLFSRSNSFTPVDS